MRLWQVRLQLQGLLGASAGFLEPFWSLIDEVKDPTLQL